MYEDGILFPFRVEAKEVELDYDRLTKAVIEAKKVLQSSNLQEAAKAARSALS